MQLYVIFAGKVSEIEEDHVAYCNYYVLFELLCSLIKLSQRELSPYDAVLFTTTGVLSSNGTKQRIMT